MVRPDVRSGQLFGIVDGMGHRIFVAKDAFKFSCAHMTVFPDGSKERLHGHNYFIELSVELEDVSFAKLVDFGPLKRTVAQLCVEWKERVLLARSNPHFTIVREDADEFEFTLCGKRYVLPTEDVLVLPIDNIVVERLAEHSADRLADQIAPGPATGGGPLTGFEVTVTESPGQGARHYRSV